jgi:hypothetical protein
MTSRTSGQCEEKKMSEIENPTHYDAQKEGVQEFPSKTAFYVVVRVRDRYWSIHKRINAGHNWPNVYKTLCDAMDKHGPSYDYNIEPAKFNTPAKMTLDPFYGARELIQNLMAVIETPGDLSDRELVCLLEDANEWLGESKDGGDLVLAYERASGNYIKDGKVFDDMGNYVCDYSDEMAEVYVRAAEEK